MSKSTSVLLFSAILLGAVPLMSTAFAADAQPVQPQATPDQQAPAAQSPDLQAIPAPAPQGQKPAQSQDGDNTAQPDPAHPYEITSFFADFQHFTLGSVVPDRYRTKKYEIIDWKTRHLPAPDEGTSWTYMGGNYVLISKEDGKIVKAESGDIFYKQ
ncbi:RcnB family protein [Erwinia sp. ErVv1]|uniref:RcnB family protein n=1 Tax=Erwinia sp. ErVv1 TaxID=1603299 RepID=UPI000829AFA8|nr:RcnB family protein [Erwinia sp. ErVv1]